MIIFLVYKQTRTLLQEVHFVFNYETSVIIKHLSLRYATPEFRCFCCRGCAVYAFQFKHMHMGKTSISAGACTSLSNFFCLCRSLFPTEIFLCLVGETHIALAFSRRWRFFVDACVHWNTFNHNDLLSGTFQVHVGT